MRALLKGGANPNARDEFNKTPLHDAVEQQFLFHRTNLNEQESRPST